jgi:hypothetical protein
MDFQQYHACALARPPPSQGTGGDRENCLEQRKEFPAAQDSDA